MNDNMGRWQTLETLPQELQSWFLAVHVESVANVNVENGIIKIKKEGFSAEELDDLIMKEGKYGKYYTEESIPQTRHDDAYVLNRDSQCGVPQSLIINPCHETSQ